MNNQRMKNEDFECRERPVSLENAYKRNNLA